MATLKELMTQREALDRQIEQTKRHDRAGAIAKVRGLMDDYGLTAADLNRKSTTGRKAGKTPVKAAGKRVGKKVAPKYRNTSTGETWSGRGLQPRWLKAALASGKKIGDFTI